MNKNFQKPQMNLPGMNESPLTTSKSMMKTEINKNSNVNVEAIVKNGETRTYLNSLAKSMLEDVKEFSAQSVDLFNSINTNVTQECHHFLKNASEHKRKVESLATEPNERSRKMEILKNLKERFMQMGFCYGGMNNPNN